jgi:hypothetical protein
MKNPFRQTNFIPYVDNKDSYDKIIKNMDEWEGLANKKINILNELITQCKSEIYSIRKDIDFNKQTKRILTNNINKNEKNK